MHERFVHRFSRWEPRESALAYMRGLIAPLQRKNGTLAEELWGLARIVKILLARGLPVGLQAWSADRTNKTLLKPARDNPAFALDMLRIERGAASTSNSPQEPTV